MENLEEFIMKEKIYNKATNISLIPSDVDTAFRFTFDLYIILSQILSNLLKIRRQGRATNVQFVNQIIKINLFLFE